MKHFAQKILSLVALLSLASIAQAQLLNTIKAGNSVTGSPAPGVGLTRHWLVGPDVQCNDGTTPAAYVRRALNVANRDNWIIYLEGGGTCDDGENCLNRWQSYASNYGIQKMSTSVPIATWNAWYPGAPAPGGWTAQGANYAVPTGIVGTGIFSTAAINPFRAWNHVYLNYCSSDQWTGQQTALATSGTDQLGTPPVLPGSTVGYDIHFNGANILDQAIADLRAGLVYCSGDNCQTMPDLDGASTILLAGASAGANGVKHNLDRFRAEQLARNAATRVRGVIDAAGAPSSSNLPWPVAPAPMTSYQDRIDKTWTNVYLAFWNARVDDSCQILNAVGTSSRCADATHVLRHHLTTPFFHRMDLQDENSIDSYQNIFYPAPPYPAFVAPLKLASGVADQLQEIGNYGAWLAPRYPAELSAIAADPDWSSPGTFGPRCQNHVGITGNIPFFNQELPTPGGVLINYADALFGWATAVPTGLGGGTGPVLIESVGIGVVGFAPCN